jgi:hypothetical protein
MMKALSRVLLLGVLTVMVPAVSFSASQQVLLVFSSNSEINRHLYSVLGGALGDSGYQVTATLQPGTVTPGKYKTVVVLSTRVATGLEPSLEAFVKGYPAPAEIYLVSLLSRSSDLTVKKLSKGSSGGVDGIAAATQWSGASQSMHGQWIHALLTYLKTK